MIAGEIGLKLQNPNEHIYCNISWTLDEKRILVESEMCQTFREGEGARMCKPERVSMQGDMTHKLG